MTSKTGQTIDVSSVSAAAAEALIREGAKKAEELGQAMAIAVCDHAGILKGFLRMDGAHPLAGEIAQNKAYSAAAFGISTDQWFESIKDDPPLVMGLPHTPRLTVFGGGYPIYVGDALVGGIGVSGGPHYSEDMECAKAALEANGFQVG